MWLPDLSTRRRHHELMDAIATILGGVIGIAVTMAILMKLFY